MSSLTKITPIGRFAPSPTGSLHLGSLYTAVASFLQARSQQGQWLVRIDDLDTPRNVKGAADTILFTLDAFGLHWDDSVVYQSLQLDVYEQILNDLRAVNLTYPCVCSRKTLTTAVYPRICRDLQLPTIKPYAVRIKTDNRHIVFEDQLQGLISTHLARQHGDFILKRKDAIFSYQFAVVIDDYQQAVNQVVRGFDLLESTPRQIYLQQLLGLPTPEYMHVPIIVDERGCKLSKQTKATAVDLSRKSLVLFKILTLLKQNPPADLHRASLGELLNWAIVHWNPRVLKNLTAIN